MKITTITKNLKDVLVLIGFGFGFVISTLTAGIVKNVGQIPIQTGVRFFSEAQPNQTRYLFRATGVSAIHQAGQCTGRIDLNWLNTQSQAVLTPQNPSALAHYYYTPERGGLMINQPIYQTLTYQNLYPNIDLEYHYSEKHGIKYDIVVHPGGRWEDIALTCLGADTIYFGQAGELWASNQRITLVQTAPVAFMLDGQTRYPVAAAWKTDGQRLWFSLGDYDRKKTLIIDPFIKVWATYYGGSNSDRASAIVADPSGNLYFAGATASPNLPVTDNAFQANLLASTDAFVVKFAPDGRRLWATYFGGNGETEGNSLTLDLHGNLNIAGSTRASRLPITENALQKLNGGDYDLFILQLNPVGQRNWASFFGGKSFEECTAIVTDSRTGGLFLTGYTNSNNLSVSEKAAQKSNHGETDAFILALDPGGQKRWATYLGGSAMDGANSITTNHYGQVIVTGVTKSRDFPISEDASQLKYAGGGPIGGDAFLATFSPDGERRWVTFFGGAGEEEGISIATDPRNDILIAGYTLGQGFPVSFNALQTTNKGESDIFIAKFNDKGQRIWSTLLGGNGQDYAFRLITDSKGYAIVVGRTNSKNFPITSDAFQTVNAGGLDVIITRLNPVGELIWSTYMGGASDDEGHAVCFNSNQDVFVTGRTKSLNFGSTPEAFQKTLSAGWDGFLVKLKYNEETEVQEVYDTPEPTTKLRTEDVIIIKGKVQNVKCHGGLDGKITLTVEGGDPPYKYRWSTGAITKNLENLAPGTYTVTVSEAMGFERSATFVVTQPLTPITLQFKTKNANCNGNKDGRIDLSITGGTPPFVVKWSDGAEGTARTGLDVGAYTVTVTDGNGCSGLGTTVINRAPPVVFTLASKKPGCGNINDGMLEATVTQGKRPFAYLWSTGQITPKIDRLDAGTYTVTVTDSTGCSVYQSVTLLRPPAMGLQLIGVPTTCPQTQDGRAELTVTGGTPPMTYKWSNGSFQQNITGLAPGNYTVTVSDAGGCTFTNMVVITPAVKIEGTLQVRPISCPGQRDGAIDATVKGGAMPLSFAWSNGMTTEDLAGLAPGSYTLKITDLNGCTLTLTANLANPPVIQAGIIPKPPSCNGPGNDGSLTVQVTAGRKPFNYVWSNGIQSNAIASLFAGTYTVTITDSAGCTKTLQYVLEQPKRFTLNLAGKKISCVPGAADGSIDVVINGGTPPFQYVWQDGQTTPKRTNLGPGTYTLVVTDTNRCREQATITLLKPDPIILSPVVNPPKCGGKDDGTITLNARGGMPPYRYVWSNGATMAFLNNLPAGAVYSVTVTDSSGCSATFTTTFNRLQPFTVSVVGKNPRCHGQNTGTADLTTNGGRTPFFYKWSNEQTTKSLSNLPAGTYSVTVTDSAGCTTANFIKLEDPFPFNLTGVPFNVLCRGTASGYIDITVSGGTSPYTYQWNNGQTTQDIRQLTKGDYAVTVTDANNCVLSRTFTVRETDSLNVSRSIKHVSCNKGQDGFAKLNISGGMQPYTVRWSNGQTGLEAQNLSAGSYTAAIVDVNNCTLSQTIVITEPPAIAIRLNATNQLCADVENGSINVELTGGVPPFTFAWSNNDPSSELKRLGAGTYTLTLTDANGCKSTATATIKKPEPMRVAFTKQIKGCGLNATVSIKTLVQNGMHPYNYRWSSNESVSDLSEKSAGTYTITVTDSYGCFTSATITVTTPPILEATITSKNPGCPPVADGGATVKVAGGVMPYKYVWSNGSPKPDATNLTDGTFTVTVTDSLGCTVSRQIILTRPPQLRIEAKGFGVFCKNDGRALVNVFSGKAPFTYRWSNGTTTAEAKNLDVGSYTVIVTDSLGCTTSAGVTLSKPEPLVLKTDIKHPTCPQSTDGSATVQITGGRPPYGFRWSNNTSGQALSNLAPGQYSVTVTDSAGCTAASVINLIAPPVMVVSITPKAAGCTRPGSAKVSITNGKAPYSFTWSDGTKTESPALSAGNHQVTITDAAGCTATGAVTITKPEPIELISNVKSVTCANSKNGIISIKLKGGQPPYAYLWSNGAKTPDLNGLDAGTYTVNISDSAGCTASKTFTLTQPEPITITVTSVNAKCPATTDGSATAQVIGGKKPFTYRWSNGLTGEKLTGLNAGSYTVTVTDSAGCTTASNPVIITKPNPLVLKLLPKNPSCPGKNDGELKASPSGGTVPYSYVWSSGATTETANGLTAGSYTLTLTDANGCLLTQSTTLTSPKPLSVSVAVKAAGCAVPGAATATAIGGKIPYKFAWSNGNIGEKATNLQPGSYKVTLTDSAGCTTYADFTVTKPEDIALNFITKNPTCFSQKDGKIEMSITGGRPPFAINWSNGSTIRVLTGLEGGTYTVNVSDSAGCAATKTITLIKPQPLTINGQVKQPTCVTTNNGEINLTIAGNRKPFSYKWSNGQTSANVTNLAPGVYSVTVTDSVQCTATAQFMLIKPVPVSVFGSVINPTCPDAGNGAVALKVTGRKPYVYIWSNGQTTETVGGLMAGVYSVTVSDSAGCTTATNFMLVKPKSIEFSLVTKPAGCEGQPTGSVILTLTAARQPVKYQWSNGAVTKDLNALLAETYTVTVTDSAGCTALKTAQVTRLAAVKLNVAGANPTCETTKDGKVTAEATAGTPPYTYKWSNGITLSTQTGLSAGVFTVTVTDAAGCSAVGSQTLAPPSPALNVTLSPTPITCAGEADGKITANINGGKTPYTTTWSNNQTSTTIQGLKAGIYTVTVKDALGCTVSANVSLITPVSLKAQTTTKRVSCPESADGVATVTVTQGRKPYTYKWSNGATTSDLQAMTAGTYSVTVSDSAGCTVVLTALITKPEPITVKYKIVNPACNGANDGQIDLNVTGGRPPYTYQWKDNNNITVKSRTGLDAGLYEVVVKDSAGCKATASIKLTRPEKFSIESKATIPTCFDYKDATLKVIAKGGKAPFKYTWSNGATTAEVRNLAAGTYTITATDSLGCTAFGVAIIKNPEPLKLSAEGKLPPCSNANNGTATVTVTGGRSGYKYKWSNGATTAVLNNLAPGSYSVTVTDSVGCSTNTNLTIVRPPALMVRIDGQGPSCPGKEDGKLTPNVQNGQKPYTYKWSSGASEEVISGAKIGIYTLTVTDASGCTASATVELKAPVALRLVIKKKNTGCNNENDGKATVTVEGGKKPYRYQWSAGGSTQPEATGLAAGRITVTVTDSLGCMATTFADIERPAGFSISLKSMPISCASKIDGKVEVLVKGGKKPYKYTWSTGATTDKLINLNEGVYSVTVTDSVGCAATAKATLKKPEALGLVLRPQNPACADTDNGMIDALVKGGRIPYNYLWSNKSTDADLNKLAAGVYTLTVTDSSGCTVTSSVTLIKPAPMTATTKSKSTGCATFNDGAAFLTHTGGKAPFTYKWSSGSTSKDASNLSAGTYTVTVADSLGCTVTATVVVASPQKLTVKLTRTNPTCNGAANGRIEVQISGGTIPYTVNWQHGPKTQDLQNLPAGKYKVMITDANGCTVADTISLIQPPALKAKVTGKTTICKGESVTLDAGEGYSAYKWSTGETTQTITVSTSGIFTAEVTKAGLTCKTEPIEIKVADPPREPKITRKGDTLMTYSADQYQWYVNSVAIKDGTNQRLIVSQAGEYKVRVTDANGCYALSPAVSIQPSGAPKRSTITAKVIPEPLQMAQFVIEFTLVDGPFALVIIDPKGENVFTKEFDGKKKAFEIPITLKSYTKGQYMLIIKTLTGDIRKPLRAN